MATVDDWWTKRKVDPTPMTEERLAQIDECMGKIGRYDYAPAGMMLELLNEVKRLREMRDGDGG